MDYAVRMGWAESIEKTKMYGGMLIGKNLGNILMLVIVGALLGLSVAKTGFGTECGLINPELGREVEKGDDFAALSLHIFLVALVMFIAWAGFGIMEGHRGLLLGIGTVLMIGCEFRNYGRTGLLYITGLLIWPFFYLGYLPYTLARDFWDNLMMSAPYAPTTFVPALIAPQSPAIQMLIYALYIAFWGYMFIWAMKRGARNIGVKAGDLFKMSSEDMYLARLEKLEREGRFDEIDRLEKDLAAMASK